MGIEVGQVYRYANGKTVTVTNIDGGVITCVNTSGYYRTFNAKYFHQSLTLVGVNALERESKDQRIKELESTILDLQSELSRKKMSLTVACNRVEELEDKLVKCQEIAMRLGIKYSEGEWSETDYARNALEKIGELK